MGRRKNESSFGKKPLSSPSTSAPSAYPISPLENEELKRIRAAHSDGKFEEALEMAENACQIYKDCSFFHRLHGRLALDLSVEYESEMCRALLYKAAVSSRRAIKHFPNSMEYRYFHASVLASIAAEERKGFEKVFDECERALAVKNPEEPFWDLYMSEEDKREKLKNRPERVRKLITSLISNTRSLQTHARNTIAALLKSGGNQVGEGQSEAVPMAERPRRKTKSELEVADFTRLDQIRSYWNSMSLEMKRNLFQVSVEDLKKHCTKLLDDVVEDCSILDIIIPVFSETKRWSFYLCHSCGADFFEVDELMQHGCIHTIKQPDPSWPTFVNDALVDDILNSNWKPCDVQEVHKIIEEEHLTVEEVLQNCPLSNDSERTQCINGIRDKLCCMIEKRILCNSHVDWLRRKVLESVPSIFQYYIYTVNLHMCIGLLQLRPLQEVLRSLEDIVNACESSGNALSQDVMEIAVPKIEFPYFTLNSSLDTIIVDTCFLMKNKGTSDDAEDVELNNPIKVHLPLIFYCRSHKEFLRSYIRKIEYKEKQWESVILSGDECFGNLSTYCEAEAELRMHANAIETVAKLFSEEQMEMADTEEYSSYLISILSKHQEKTDTVGSKDKFLESTVMGKVIAAVKSVNDHQDQCLGEVKNVIASSLKEQYEEINLMINKLDAKTMQTVFLIEGVNQMLISLSFLDYEQIISILLASFLQLSLENLAKKDAMEKALAAAEDLLKQESDDAKMKITVGVDTSNIMHDMKSRKNKKRKDRRHMELKETMGLDSTSKDLDFSQEKATGTSYLLLEDVVASENYLIEEDILGNDKLTVEEREEYNYFLNVIFKSLWHLRWFRNSFQNLVSSHTHVGDPCVLCNMNDIFVSLDNGARGEKMEIISNHTLTILFILKNSYGDRNFLTEMNVAPKVFVVILLLVHILYISTSEEHGSRSEESLHLDQYGCRCLAHTVFGMDIHENVENNFNTESEKYTSWFYKVDAHVPSQVQGTNQVNSFNNLFKDLPVRELSTPPSVLVAVINWHKECKGATHISSILAAIDTHIELSVVHHDGDNKNKYSLVCMVCYCRPKLQCFTFGHENEQWGILDGETVKETGGWNDVKQVCIAKNLQPEILFFEAEN